MKRDMELIRRMLLATEELPPGKHLEKLPDVDGPVFSEHVRLLMERKLIDGNVQTDIGGTPIYGAIFRLTWDGQDFVSTIRDDSVWKMAKERVIRPGASWSFDVLKEVLKSIVMKGLEM